MVKYAKGEDMVPAYEGKKPYIFVSYAHKDSNRVLPIIEGLFEQKYRVWYDEGIAPGSEWPKNIEKHLLGSKLVIAFVSKESLASINCDNEVQCAYNNKKDILQFSLDKTVHPTIKDAVTVSTEEKLRTLIPDKFIGDGKGYERTISRKRFANPWNIFLIVTAIIFIMMAVCFYGVKNGWFDQYLPTIVEKFEELLRLEQLKPMEGVKIEEDTLEKALLRTTGKQDWGHPVQFAGEEDRISFYHAVGKDPAVDELTYQDLACVKDEALDFEYISDDMLQYLKYVPNLKEVSFHSGCISSFDELEKCPILEKIYVGKDVLPIPIYSPMVFSILLTD